MPRQLHRSNPGERCLPSRLLKKAHLRRWRARAALRRTRKYASHLAGHPSEGWVTPPCIWTFLSSLGVNEFFSILLGTHRIDQKSDRAYWGNSFLAKGDHT